MNILIAGLKKNIQLKRLAEEGQKRGHTVDGCYSTELIIQASSENFAPSLRGKDIKKYDLIYLMVSKRRWEWYTIALYLKEKRGMVIVNRKVVDPSYNLFLTPAIDYLRQTQEGIPYPKSAVIYNHKSVESATKNIDFPLILKTSEGRQGRGIYKIGSKEELISKVRELENKSRFLVIREFIPNDGDIRVFTVGYKAIGAMKRTPPEGDFRSNISVGGRGEEYDLKKYSEVTQLAEKSAEVMQTEIAGVDIILHKETKKPYVLEVNPGPQFAGLEKYTKTNTALEIIKYFESLYNRK